MKTTLQNQASYFFTCKKEGFTPEQQGAFEAWYAQSPEHQKAFENVQKMASLYATLSKNVKDEIVQSVHQEIKREAIFRRNRYFAIAASILLVLCLGVYERYLAFFVPHSYATEKQTQQVLLPDDSTVLLDVKTKAVMRYANTKREITLEEGKALFDVAKNPDKPFIVHAGTLNIKVLGTHFEVKNYNNRVEVSVIEGIVSVETAEKESLATLTQGKKLSFDTQNNHMSLKNVPIANIASWREGILMFHDETLQSALDEFKHYQDLNISVQKEVQNFSISGSFATDEVDKFLRALTKIYALKVDKKADALYIRQKL
jgi:transmembrane sensor